MPYAIDFGTSNTVVARWNPARQAPETLSLPHLSQQCLDNPPLVPSLVYVENAQTAQILLGQTVCDRGLDQSQNQRFFKNFKRGIGAKIQGFLPELDDVSISFEQVGSWFFDGLMTALQQDISSPLDALVLTVPVDSFEAYRYWLSQRCQAWQVEQVKLLDEPTAVALGYGATTADILLVIDVGGGTADISLVQLNAKNQRQPDGFLLKWGDKILGNNPRQKTKLAQVIAKAGGNLGGSDIDDWVFQYFQKIQNLPRTRLLLRLAERLKIQLSQTEEATEVYFDDQTLDSVELTLNREVFNQILQENGFFQQLDTLMNQVIQQGRRNGILPEQIDRVLLVGGTAQIPVFQDWVKGYFNESKIAGDRPFEAIALGALQLTQGQEIKDFLYHSYGIRYWNRRKNCHSWHPIIKSGQAYPMPEPVELVLGASLENQPSIEVIMGELGAEEMATEIFFDGDRLRTRTLEADQVAVRPLNDQGNARQIALLDPPGQPGSDRIKIRFWVDQQRFLRISVEDLLMQTTLLDNERVAQLR